MLVIGTEKKTDTKVLNKNMLISLIVINMKNIISLLLNFYKYGAQPSVKHARCVPLDLPRSLLMSSLHSKIHGVGVLWLGKFAHCHSSRGRLLNF